MENMSNNLRTLKDLDIRYASTNISETKNPQAWGDKCVRVRELKAEAIKWVKTIDNNTFPFKIMTEKIILGASLGARGVLIKFFNLTEEDLK